MLRLLHRLRARIRNRRFDNDLLEELRVHEEMKRQALEASGLPPRDAQAQARRALGNITLMREDARQVWIARWLDSVAQDARYAVHALRRQPLHSLTAGIVLVMGIGLTTTLFTLFKAMALEPWPVRDPDAVVRIWARTDGRPVGPSVDEYRFMRDQVRSLSGLAAHSAVGYGSRLQVPGRAEAYLPSVWVTSNFFAVLGVPMRMGAGFVREDDATGNRRSPLVMSDAAWRVHFDRDPEVVGRAVSVSGQPFTIAGVLPPSFDGIGREVYLWMPLSALSSMRQSDIGWEPPLSANCCVNVVGRLARGVERRQAIQELQLLHQRFSSAARRASGTVQLFGTSEVTGPGGGRFGLIAAFGAAVALMLVLACANVGNLQLARALARRREISTRMSIGASRPRIVRQLLTEGLVLAGMSGAVAVAIAAGLPRVVFMAVDEEIPEYVAARLVPDAEVLGFTAAVCALSCLVFALAPALHATRMTIPLGVIDRASTRRSRFHLRGLLLATQIAACTALLAGASLVTRAVVHAMSFDPGFQLEGIDVASPTFPAGTPAHEREAFTRAALESIDDRADTPVAVAELPPISDTRFVMFMGLPHRSARDYEPVMLRRVSGRFFDVLRIPLVRGRTFDRRATAEAVVNEAFARAYWRGEDPLGKAVDDVDRKGGIRRSYTIVGVVRDTHLTGFERIEPVIFTPATTGMFITRGGPAAVERIRATAVALRPAVTLSVQPLRASVRRYLEESMVGAALAWAIGLLGLALAAVGVFGVFAYAVEERRREIGVRLALGAARGHIVRMLVSSSGRAMIAGLAAGLLLSLACGPVLRRYLFGLSALDPIAYGLVVTMLAIAAVVATFLPARRACRVDPAVTLRQE